MTLSLETRYEIKRYRQRMEAAYPHLEQLATELAFVAAWARLQAEAADKVLEDWPR